MKNISELDLAELRHEMRDMYKQVGLKGSLQCLKELLLAVDVLNEVIIEECKNAKKG